MADPDQLDADLYNAPSMAVPRKHPFLLTPKPPVEAPREIPTVGSIEEVGKLAEGSEFIDPEGTTRFKPYAVKAGDPESWRRIPEGKNFTDPQGVLRVKPTYEPLDIGVQTKISFQSGNERNIEKILGDVYGAENVKREPLTNELYIEKDGKFYKPGKGFIAPVIGEMAALALPTILGTAGGMLGAMAGAPTVVGAPLAGVAGGTAGAVAGENINQVINSLLGYPATTPELLKALGTEAAWAAGGGAAGELAGRAIGRGVQALPAFKNILPGAVASFLGAIPEKTEIAAELAKRGYSVPVTSYASEAPMAQKMLEFARQFRKEGGPLERQLQQYTDKELLGLFGEAGVTPPSSFTKAKTAVSVEPVGEALKEATVLRGQEALNRLEGAIVKYRGLGEQRAALTEVEFASRQRSVVSEFETAAAEQRKLAEQISDNSFAEIANMSRQLATEAGVTLNSGDLVRAMDVQVRELRSKLGSQARTMYSAADTMAGDVAPDVAPLRDTAHSLLNILPQDFHGRYDYMIKAIRDLDGDTITFGQLHNLRSMLRHDVNWASATNTPTEGAVKQLLKGIQTVLDDPTAAPALQKASALLKEADVFYAKNFPKFRNEQITWTLKQVQDGVPPDATVLANRFIQEGQSEQTRMLRQVAGPQTWKGVLAADTKSILDSAETVAGNYDIRTFVKEVERRATNGTLKEAYGTEQALQLQAMAVRLKAYSGGQVPIAATEGDTLLDAARKAAEYAEIAKKAGQSNPLAVLKEDAARMDKVVKMARANLDEDLGQNPLSSMFRANPSIGGIAAADRILSSPDLMLSVARTFGPQSPEAQMVRQVWWQRFFQRDVKDMSYIASEVRAMEPSVQKFLFPKTPSADMLKSVQKIGQEMEFLFPTELADIGSSLAGANRVLNPTAYIPGGRALRDVPGGNVIARYGLGWYYTTAEWALSHPQLALFIAKGLSQSEADKQAAKAVFQASYEKWLSRGRFMGFGTGSAIPQFVGQEPTPEEAPPRQSWREKQTAPAAPSQAPAPAPAPAERMPSWRDKMKQ